jgi:hypothetical protein
MSSHVDTVRSGNVFADPTIPGLSVRDLARRAMDAVGATVKGERAPDRHRDFVVRHDLARLNAEVLRDIGLDRNAQ